jgi:deoxycytidylate deaminase
MTVKKKNLREAATPDDFWMGMAFWFASASKNIQNQQGAVIVGGLGNVLSYACDSPPKSIPYSNHTRHAERAAIQDARLVVFSGSTLYITHPPCHDCILDIIASEIKRVVYFPSSKLSTDVTNIAHEAYTQLIEYKGNLSWMRDHLAHMKAIGVFS